MRILIEIPSWLGDAVMTTPAIENMFKFHKECEFIIVGSKISIEIFKNHPKVSKTFILDKSYLSMFYLSKELREFDKFVTFRNSFRSNIFKFLINSKKKFQFNKDSFQKLHQVEKYVKFINHALKTNLPDGPLVIYSIDSNNNAHSIAKNKPMLGINPGASYGSSKRWYPEKFSQVIEELSSRYDITILGGPDETDIAMDIQTRLEKKGISNYQNLAGKLTIPELITCISKFELFITADSGPMHIAATFKVPTISIFGPTRHNETSQWKNEKSIIIKKNLSCQPCMKRECPLEHHNCMRLINADDVLSKVELISL